jgi:DNA-binding GntR family transcriptional regulator
MPVPQQTGAVQRHLLRDNAYETLCEAIVAGTLAPGEALHDVELCSWLGLSRTPVRDALARLADEGLVEIAPQRYTRVAPMQPADAAHIFPVLASLHALATELAVPRLTPADLEQLRRDNDGFIRALTDGDAAEAYDADDAFHDVFVGACANPEIHRSLRHAAPRLRRLESLRTGALPGRRSVAQHEAILARAAHGDARGAASATRENWLELGALVERTLGRAASPRL